MRVTLADAACDHPRQARCAHWSHVQQHLPLLNPFRVVDPEEGVALSFPPVPEAQEEKALADACAADGGEQPAAACSGATGARCEVKYPTGDALDRATVQQALWSRRQKIESAGGKVYVVVAWRKDQSTMCGASVVCFVRSTPPDKARSPFHTDLCRLFHMLDHSREVPVVVVDAAVRREHHYTYLVVVTYPWADGRPHRLVPLRQTDDGAESGILFPG
eukprot:TRINITY_DN2999_c0_g2_i1.p1 TRINITY_DN2999_c0_g2~~TRINITY_DN2999_c0_g2_i1.p1  ORF type:complete len:245 (+),score=39.56 TRINITY_DN2999_c0_g2_i1:79-735(+)